MSQPEPKPARREALIVAADRYEDPKLRGLRAPARDAEELARVLGDPELGDFNVAVSLNEPDHVVRRKLSEFFRERDRDDLLVLHVSCHGLKDEDGTLYFASSNTEVSHLEATAIPSEFVNRQMTKSRSRRVVLLLDCCFGGAFARGMVHRAGESVELKEEFEGQGRVVLTASRAMEYAFEGDNREGDAQPSVFTSAIVQGLETGEADRDGDSRVSVDELYDYVYDQVREATPNQTPSKWTFDVHGDLYLARSPYREPEAVALPVELKAAMESPFAHVRAGAVEELAGLNAGAVPGLALAARAALEQLADDDSKRVSDAAARALADEAAPAPAPAPVELAPPAAEPVAAPPVTAAPATPPPPRARRERSSSQTTQLAVALARVARFQPALALGGAALLVLGYFQRASWDSALYFARHFDTIWAVWSPLEALGAVLLVALAVLGSRRGKLARESADGIFLAVGGIVLVAMIAFVASPLELAGTSLLTALGALAIGAAGALGVLTRRGPELGLPRRTGVIVATGTALAFAPLVVTIYSDPHTGLFNWESGFYIEVLAAGAAAILAVVTLFRAPRARLLVAGALMAGGALLALHLSGLMVQVAKWESASSIRFGAPLGVLGGILLLAAGVRVIRAERQPAEVPAAAGIPAT